MDAHALTIKTVRDGPVCTLMLCGDLDLLETGMPDGFQGLAAVRDRLCNFRPAALAGVVPPAGSRSAAGSAPAGLRLCGRRDDGPPIQRAAGQAGAKAR
jgi:hypothetical protein